MKHGSVWLDRTERAPFSGVAEDLEVDVVVVGAGLVGLTTAVLARQAGVRVAVLEASRVGDGTTGHTTGKVTSQHGLIYAGLIERHGESAARQYADANQAGVEQVATLVGEFGIEADLTRAPAYAYTVKVEQREQIEAEVAAARRLGLPAHLTNETGLPFVVEAAARFEEQLHFHPGRYLAGLADAFVRAGGVILENTRVTGVNEQDGQVRVSSVGGSSVRADRVVVASLLPIGMLGGYFAKARPVRSYALAVRLRGPAPTGMTISIDAPTHSTRPWLDPGPNGLIVVGGGHETGAGPDLDSDPGAPWAELEAWTRDTFAVDHVDYGWSSQDYTTPDQIPYIGRAPLTQNVLVATGFNKWGLSAGTAAAMILNDLIAGRDSPWAPIFDATRIGDAATVGRLVKDNLKVGAELLTGHLARPQSSIRELPAGQAGIVDIDGRIVGGYHDHDGALHAVVPTCTHLGCRLRWNAAETSWDCHCHGSRFDPDGAILNGPAVDPLERVDVEAVGEDPATGH